MTETTVERKTRNKMASIIMLIFAGILVLIIGWDFYKLFHSDANKSLWIKILDGLQLTSGVIALLWLALILIVSSMTMSGPSFRKTLPYTIPFIFTVAVEIIQRLIDSEGFFFWFWLVLGVVIFFIVMLQMVAFNLDPHSHSIFRDFRPFKIEILTVIQLSSQAPSVKQSGRSSIV